jgi:hypothetical protein
MDVSMKLSSFNYRYIWMWPSDMKLVPGCIQPLLKPVHATAQVNAIKWKPMESGKSETGYLPAC